MLAAYFLLEPRVSFVPSKFVKPLSFQLFCYRKIIIHLSTMTGCWKTWIMDSVGPWNSNQAIYCQLKPLQNDNSFSVYLKIALNHHCLSDHLTTINFHSQTQIWMREGKWNIDLFGKGVLSPSIVDNTIKTPSSTLNYFTIVQIVRVWLRDSGPIFRVTLTLN